MLLHGSMVVVAACRICKYILLVKKKNKEKKTYQGAQDALAMCFEPLLLPLFPCWLDASGWPRMHLDALRCGGCVWMHDGGSG